MAAMIKIRNWDKWQSYRKDRGQPPWIKVHRSLMRDVNWVSLTDAQRGQLVAIWMLAADHDGSIPDDPTIIRKLCFMESDPDLKAFIDAGFIEGRRRPDAVVTPPRRQHDQPETEEKRDREETEKNTGAVAPPAGAGLTVIKPLQPHQEFVERFKFAYGVLNPGHTYDDKKADFILAAALIKEHGLELCVIKAKTLGVMCRRKSAFFTKSGGADFTIGTLKQWWNKIVPDSFQPTQDEDLMSELKKQEALRAGSGAH